MQLSVKSLNLISSTIHTGTELVCVAGWDGVGRIWLLQCIPITLALWEPEVELQVQAQSG